MQVYSTPERDKFRTRLERADGRRAPRSTSAIAAWSRCSSSASRQQTMWQPRNPDPDLEAEFLRRLMVRLGSHEEQAKKTLAAAQSQAPARAALAKDIGGFETLEVFEPFDRTWRRVGLALDRVGFTVEDRDRQNGQYFVRYADPEAEMAKKDASRPGLLARLAFWRSDDPKVKAEQYRVHVRQTVGKCVVQVLNKDGSADGSPAARRIIALLYEQLK
ncbi:MAG: outer membrane protein assembly factor BamC [Burkholderiales bacterium]|nr:outer membrane protein assembly factor BamC [Burkholderiales bacterium]